MQAVPAYRTVNDSDAEQAHGVSVSVVQRFDMDPDDGTA
jgi:hypothetical protein